MTSLLIRFTQLEIKENEFHVEYPHGGVSSLLHIPKGREFEDKNIALLQERYSQVTVLRLENDVEGVKPPISFLIKVITSFPHLVSMDIDYDYLGRQKITTILSQLPSSLRVLTMSLDVSSYKKKDLKALFQLVQMRCPQLISLAIPKFSLEYYPDFLSDLGNLPQTLTHFDLSHGSLKGYDYLGLQTLINKVLENFPSLQSFGLSLVTYEGLVPEKIDILQKVIAQKQLQSLKFTDIDDLDASDWLAVLSGLNERNLDAIDLSGNNWGRFINIDLINLFACLEKVNTLNLSKNFYGRDEVISALACIPSATRLILRNNMIQQITREFLTKLKGISGLMSIDLRENDFSDKSQGFILSDEFLELISEYQVTLDIEFFTYPYFESHNELEKLLESLPYRLSITLGDEVFDYRALRQLLICKIILSLLKELKSRTPMLVKDPGEPFVILENHLLGHEVFDSPESLRIHWESNCVPKLNAYGPAFFAPIYECRSKLNAYIQQLAKMISEEKDNGQRKSALKIYNPDAEVQITLN